MEDEEGWTKVHSKKYLQAVSKTKQAINRIVGQTAYKDSITQVALKRKADDISDSNDNNTGPTKKPLLTWGMWDESTAKNMRGGKLPRKTVALKKTTTTNVDGNYEWWMEGAKPMDEQDQLKIIQVFEKNFPRRYAALDEKTADRLLRKEKVLVQVVQALVVYKHYLRLKVMKNLQNLEKYIPQIVELYDKQQKSLLEVSEMLDFPPVLCFRALLIGRKMAIDQIQLVMHKPKTAKKFEFLSPRDNKQLFKAYQRDMITSELSDKTFKKKGKVISETNIKKARRATKLEKQIEKWLEEIGVDFLTEEQQRENGAMVATPDFLIRGGLDVDGTTIYWIDAKSFYGTDFDTIKAPIQNMVNKYTDIFGMGLIVFSLGFMPALQDAIPNVLMVNASEILQY